LEHEVNADNVTARSRLASVLTIFRGFRIVKREKAKHNKYIWMGRDDEEIERVLKSMLESSNSESQDILWNICSVVLRALMTARKESRVFLPIIGESFAVNESRRLTIAASILEGMGMVEKFTDELGGLAFKGPSKPYEDFKQTIWDTYGNEYNLKKVQMSLSHVEVKEEHRYPIKPPCFDFSVSLKGVDIPPVPEELKNDTEIQRAIANMGKVCRCGSTKELKGNQRIIQREGGKSHIRKQVYVGGKRKMRCKKCTGCLAPKCKKCNFCTKPHLKKPCERRNCLFPVVPKCPCFI